MNSTAKILRDRLEGALIPAVPVPFDADGNYRPEAEAQLVAYHAASPSAGVAVWVHTGRGLMLDPSTRRGVIQRWRAGLRRDQFIVAGVGCPRQISDAADATDEKYLAGAAAMAEEARALGAEAVLVHAPTRFRGREDQDRRILDYHEAIASAGLPIILFYLYEAAGGVSYSPELVGRLLALPSVAGIKIATLDSVMMFQALAELVKARSPGAALLTGEDRFLGYTLMRGAVGALIGMGAACPAEQAELISAWRGRRYDRFHELSAAIDHFAETTFIPPMEGYIRRMLLALAALGVIPESAAHDPWGPAIDPGDPRRIETAARRLRGI